MKYIVKILYGKSVSVAYWLSENNGTTSSRGQAHRYTATELATHQCKGELLNKPSHKTRTVLVPVKD